jgi:hypothetical protein
MPKFKVRYRRVAAVGSEVIEADNAEDAERKCIENLDFYIALDYEKSQVYVSATEVNEKERD